MKKVVTLCLVALLIIGGVAYFARSVRVGDASLEAHEFGGTLVSIEGNVLTLEGVYSNDGKAVGERKTYQAKIAVGENTVITREAFQVPTDTSKPFSPDNLPKQTSTVQLAKIVEDMQAAEVGILVHSDKNIFGESSFVADTILYRIPIFNTPQQ